MQIVRFAVSGRHVAFPVTHVREVVTTAHLSAVFHAPPYVAGLMNLRGEAVPVLDLAVLFDFMVPEQGNPMVVIAEAGAYVAGFLADRPVDILDVPAGAEAPVAEGTPCMAALDRVLLIDGETVLVLSPERLFELPQVVSLRTESDWLGG
jgi:purine-binding chemotaxis protein CheW